MVSNKKLLHLASYQIQLALMEELPPSAIQAENVDRLKDQLKEFKKERTENGNCAAARKFMTQSLYKRAVFIPGLLCTERS